MKIELLSVDIIFKSYSLKVLKIIKEILIPFSFNRITVIKENGLFLIDGWSKDILIYRIYTYENLEKNQKCLF